MSPNHLRVYYGPQEEPAAVNVTESQTERQTVTVPLMDVLPLLAMRCSRSVPGCETSPTTK